MLKIVETFKSYNIQQDRRREESMVYGVIVAGGIGSRMGNTEKPKQYMEIGSKPIIIHTISKFAEVDRIDKTLALCPKEWIEYTENLIARFLPDNNVTVLEGGATRNDTIMNAIKHIELTDGLNDDAILITHDAVRPLVTKRIIEENIEIASTGTACSTMIPATDTIAESPDGVLVTSIPERSRYYQCQTPQSFSALRFKTIYESLSDEERAVLTDAGKVFVLSGEPVKIVRGETFNIKITYPQDLVIAEALLG